MRDIGSVFVTSAAGPEHRSCLVSGRAAYLRIWQWLTRRDKERGRTSDNNKDANFIICSSEQVYATRRATPAAIDRHKPVSYHENFVDESTPAIEIQNLRKVYGSKAAVDGLTLTVQRGSFFGF